MRFRISRRAGSLPFRRQMSVSNDALHRWNVFHTLRSWISNTFLRRRAHQGITGWNDSAYALLEKLLQEGKFNQLPGFAQVEIFLHDLPMQDRILSTQTSPLAHECRTQPENVPLCRVRRAVLSWYRIPSRGGTVGRDVHCVIKPASKAGFITSVYPTTETEIGELRTIITLPWLRSAKMGRKRSWR